MMITQIFEDISSFRQRSVVDVLKIRQEYARETSVKPSLITVERNVIGYIAGYMCRKTRDRLQRCNNEKFSRVLSVLNQKLLSMKTAPAAMSFPNLMSLILSRGGLSLVDYSIFNLFCYVEVSIRPFLNLARFRCSTRRSDTELLAQEIVLWNRSMQFKRRFLYSTWISIYDFYRLENHRENCPLILSSESNCPGIICDDDWSSAKSWVMIFSAKSKSFAESYETVSVWNHHQAIRCCYEIVCGIITLCPKGNVGFTSGRSVVELSWTELGSETKLKRRQIWKV